LRGQVAESPKSSNGVECRLDQRPMSQRQVPLLLHDEHHEAAAAWISLLGARAQSSDLVLINFDSHSDLDEPRTWDRLPPLGGNIRDVYDFVIRNLDIGDFVFAAAYCGVFNTVLWVRPPSPQDDAKRNRPRSRVYELVNLDPDRCYLVTRPKSSKPQVEAAASRQIKVIETFTPRLPSNLRMRPFILSIDLDYFSCNADPRPIPIEVEITAEQYRALLDPRHPLNIVEGRLIRLVKTNGSHYLRFARPVKPPSAQRCSEQQIVERVDGLCAALAAATTPPVMITVARSLLSGYTPADQAAYIEEILLAALRRRYFIEPITMSGLLGERPAAEGTQQC
jgi:UPF0489 domain